MLSARILLTLIMLGTNASASLNRPTTLFETSTKLQKRQSYTDRPQAMVLNKGLKRQKRLAQKIPEKIRPGSPVPPGPLDWQEEPLSLPIRAKSYLELSSLGRRVCGNVLMCNTSSLERISFFSLYGIKRRQNITHASLLLKTLVKRKYISSPKLIILRFYLARLYRTNELVDNTLASRSLFPLEVARDLLEDCLKESSIKDGRIAPILYELAKVEEAEADQSRASYDSAIELCRQVLTLPKCHECYTQKATELMSTLIRR